jgi:hypothetical protein
MKRFFRTCTIDGRRRDHIYHFYLAILTLKSWSHTFEENYGVYKEFIEHFKTGNFMYGKDEAEK